MQGDKPDTRTEDDDWIDTDPEYDDAHEPKRCHHGMPKWGDWCTEDE
jgi:hypothetical protein